MYRHMRNVLQQFAASLSHDYCRINDVPHIRIDTMTLASAAISMPWAVLAIGRWYN